jgi:hypothetical protein
MQQHQNYTLQIEGMFGVWCPMHDSQDTNVCYYRNLRICVSVMNVIIQY